MCEPAPSAQLLTEQGAVQTDGGGSQASSGLSSVSVHPSPECDDASHADRPPGGGNQNLHTEVVQLRRAMQTRPVIDQACGVLIATFGLSPETAWSVLVATSQNTNTKLHRLAGDLVDTAQGDPLPEAVQKQLTAAVNKAKSIPSPSSPAS